MTASMTRRQFVRATPVALPFLFAPSRLLWAQGTPPPPPPRHAVPAYTQTTLVNVIEGEIDHAVDINASGVITGWSATEERGISAAVVWRTPGTAALLPTLGGAGAEARAINDAGHIVGGAQDADGNVRPVLWSDGVATDLGTLGGAMGFATALNERDQVVGYAETADGATHPFLWEEGEMTDLAGWEGDVHIEGLPDDEVRMILDLGGMGQPEAINAEGVIVGAMGSPPFFMHPVIWRDGEMVDLGTLGGDFAGARGINDHGQVVGWSRLTVDEPLATEASERGHAFLWEAGTMRDLGAPAVGGWSRATDINAAGQVAGMGGDTDEDTEAMLLLLGAFARLGGPGAAYGINDAGVVVGAVDAPGGATVGALWTPAS